MTTILKARNISKSFEQGKEKISVLKNLNFEIESGKSISIVGESGCGKSTLLQIIGLLLNSDSGTLEICGKNIGGANDKIKTRSRLESIGFIFQYHHLLSDFSALENVIIPQLLIGENNTKAQLQAKELLEKLGLKDRMHHRPSELSGGQQQRVAIARSLANNPKMILADEPTGNLDPENTKIVTDLFFEITTSNSSSLVIVTHNQEISKKTNLSYCLKDGKLTKL